MRAVYLDYQATTPVDPRVLDAMLPYFIERFGNPASAHVLGEEANRAVTVSRAAIARAIGAREPAEIIFTSGATEADNLAVKGAAYANTDRGDHIVTVQTEHRAVLDACRSLEREGFQVTYLRVQPDGLLDLDDLAAAITDRTTLVSVMTVNNEIGVIQDIAAIGSLCRERGVLFHTDATQAVGKIPFHVQEMGVHLASLTAHKIYGPKGIGALYVRRRDPEVRVGSLLDGGGHERGLRSGTLNVPGIVGLAAALALCQEEMEAERRRLTALRTQLLQSLQDGLGEVRINGNLERRIPGNLNICISGVDSERLLSRLPDLCLSGGSACSSGQHRQTHVIGALGIPPGLGNCAIRIGLGRYTSAEEVTYAARRIVEEASALKSV